MGRGKALSEDARRIVFNLHKSQLLTVDQLSKATGVSQPTIYRIGARYERTGDFGQDGERTGRPRVLDYANTQVSLPIQ